jgi:maltose alpha-D-glucosyltransferase/alpha-amylase
LLLTWPGVPFVYYGDEIGMRYLPGLPSKEGGYERTGTRTPMQWEPGPGAGFSSADPADFYLPLDPSPDRPDVASQRADPHSLWHYVRTLVAARRREPALRADASLELCTDGAGYPLAYLREAAGERVLVVLQPAAAVSEVPLPAGTRVAETLAARRASVDGDRVHLEGPAVGVYRLTGEG